MSGIDPDPEKVLVRRRVALLMHETRERDPELAKTLAAEIVRDARLAEPEFRKPLFRPGVLDRFLGRYSADSWRLGEPPP